MQDNKFRFTHERLRKLKHDGSKKRLLYWDTDTKGLVLCLTKAGVKSFQFQMWSRAHKKSMVQTLGTFPALSLKEAREQATAKRMRINAGEDIVATARGVRDEDTFAVMFERWLEQFAKPHKKSWNEDERRYNLYMKKQFGNKKVSWFTTSYIRKWHSDITRMEKQKGKKGTTVSPATANRALALVSTVFNQMRPETLNPCKGIKKFKERSRDRFLQPDELKNFFTSLHDPATPEHFRDYILLSLFTGARRGNILAMRWSEVSFDRQVWTVPADKSKNADAMDIPLIDESLEILLRRKEKTSSVFVFPGKGRSGHYQEPRKAWVTLLKRAGLTDVRLHDLRRTMGSYQTITGASTTIVGKTLGHKSQAATAVYARLNLDPVRESMKTAVEAMLATKKLPKKVVRVGEKYS